jgi:predicted negative regulator of RcsB-dependent stress response
LRFDAVNGIKMPLLDKENTMSETNPENQPVKPHAEPEEIPAIVDQVKSYIPSAITGVVVAVLLYVGWTWYSGEQRAKQDEAAQMLNQAQTVEQYQALLDSYPDSIYAPVAQLGLAAQLFHDGNVDQARATYDAFLAANPNHPMSTGAQLGLVSCDEAAGALEAALVGYREFIAQHPDHYLTATAQLGEARVLTQLGRFEEAGIIYDALQQIEDENWQAQALSGQIYMEKLQRAAAIEAAVPAPESAAESDPEITE